MVHRLGPLAASEWSTYQGVSLLSSVFHTAAQVFANRVMAKCGLSHTIYIHPPTHAESSRAAQGMASYPSPWVDRTEWSLVMENAAKLLWFSFKR